MLQDYNINLDGRSDVIDAKANWFARANLGPSVRYDVGLTYKIPLKKKKP